MLAGAWDYGFVPAWLAGVLLLAWVVKDIALYPALRPAYVVESKTGAEQLVGCRAQVSDRLAPQGYVRLRGELWRAELDGGVGTIESGAQVVVVGVDGLVLQVRADANDGAVGEPDA